MKRIGIKEDMAVYQNAISKLVNEHKGKKPHKHPHPEGGPLATVDEKFTMKDFKSNEDGNDHTQNAVELVKLGSKVIGGTGGGGRNDFAQAGGNLPEKIEKSFQTIIEKI